VSHIEAEKTESLSEPLYNANDGALLRSVRRGAAVGVGWLGLVGVWYFFSKVVWNEFRLPPPDKVVREMWEIIKHEDVYGNFKASIFKVFYGFFLAILVGTPLGFLMGKSKWWNAFFNAPVVIAGSVPSITYAVMSLVIFGISSVGPVLVTGIIAMPYIALNVSEGVQGVDRGLIQMSQAFGRSPSDVMRQVIFPSVTPFVFAGLRLAFAISWKVEQLTEVFGSGSGVGFQIRRSFNLFNITGVLAWVLLFVAFMLIFERLVLARLERYLFRWRTWESEKK
jgi:NitT/TauT family transport system permease protein